MLLCQIFWLRQEIVFGVTYELTVQQRRNGNSEGRDDGQMTFLNFYSFIQNLGFFCIPDRQTDRQMDGQTDREINPVWAV